MALTGVLEAVIGLVFIYFLTCMFCSGINELIAQERGRRGQFLREGLVNLVADRWLYLRLINHPLVASLYRDVPGKPRTPSYVPASNFTNALLDVVVLKAEQLDPDLAKRASQARTFEDLRVAVLKCKENGYTVGDAILPLLDAAQGNLDQARKHLEAWYESGMERVTGWYKMYTRRVLLGIGLAAAVLLNIDTLQIVRQLAQSASLRKSLADAATQVVETRRFNGVPLEVSAGDIKIAHEHLKQFAAGIAVYEQQGLPVGFSCLNPEKIAESNPSWSTVIRNCWHQTKNQSVSSWVLKGLGWLLTALAVSLGAPFWFDLLNKLVDFRGAGKKPAAPVPEVHVVTR
jgi:hypothetical protein